MTMADSQLSLYPISPFCSLSLNSFEAQKKRLASRAGQMVQQPPVLIDAPIAKQLALALAIVKRNEGGL
jgi:hypothetical protein